MATNRASFPRYVGEGWDGGVFANRAPSLASSPSPPSLQDALAAASANRSAGVTHASRNLRFTPVAGGTTTRVAPGAD